MKLEISNIINNFFLFLFILFPAILFSHSVLINEFMASNSETIEHPPGSEIFPDWIELYNTSEKEINLKGFFLSDKETNPLKWKFPNVIIQPKSFLLIFASDEGFNPEQIDKQDPKNPFLLHTNFKISNEGETILFSDQSGLLLEKIEAKEIQKNHSFGRKTDSSSEWVFYENSSPGFSNNDYFGYGEYCSPPNFSHIGGFYKNPFSLSLQSENSNYKIYYSLNGTDPDEASTIFAQDIEITKTTVIKARTFQKDSLPGKIVTHSYIFFNREVTLPVVSLATDPENLWSKEKGIYIKGESFPTEESILFGTIQAI